MNIYAMCLYNTGGSTASILSQAQAAPNTYTRGEAVCPSGSTVVGGGFINGSDGALELYNSSLPGQPSLAVDSSMVRMALWNCITVPSLAMAGKSM